MMKSQNKHDLIIVGGGPGGYVAAIRASQLGIKTALIEKEKVGGTCLHKGCIPTKALLHSAHLYSICKNGKAYGIDTGEITVNYGQVHKKKEQVVNRLFQGVRGLLKKNKVDVFEGTGRLGKDTMVSVEKEGEDSIELHVSHIILATGSAPLIPRGISVDGKCILTSDEIIDLTSIPDSIIIAGGGAIGVEFASLFNALGSKVTILEMKGHLLPAEDTDVSVYIEKSLRNLGIDIVTSASLDSAVAAEHGVEVELSIEGKKETKMAGILLLALGRVPNADNIGLYDAGIDMKGKFVLVDERQKTARDTIYAIGDLTGPLLLAHAASAQGIAVVNSIAGNEFIPLAYNNIPAVTYSFPQVASVGLTQEKAETGGYKVKVGRFPFKANGRAVILGEDTGFVKLISDENNGKLLGAHLIGPEVSELIGEFSLALHLGLSADTASTGISPHPTLSEAVKEAFHAIDGRAIHM